MSGPSSADVVPATVGQVSDDGLVVVTMVFNSTSSAELAGVLAAYVVGSRGHDGCLNIDLLVSALDPNRFTVVQKWVGGDHQRAHFDSPEMVEMARSAVPLLASPPTIELHHAISAHDLI